MGSEVDCGLNTSESLASYDLNTSSWKTSQLCLEGESTEFSGTWPQSGMVRNGKLYMRPTLGCRIVENESLLLPTPTRSFGVNARGWGLSQTGRLRYSQQTEDNAKRFGYRPPIALLEWMMGFPENHTAIELAASGMPLSLQQQNGLVGKSLTTISGHAEASPTGLSIGSDLSYAEWESIGFDLAKVGKAMQWWIGDWVNYGGKRYGETYKAAIEATGMSYGTVTTFASVCKAFESSRRKEHLTFTHHMAVWSLEPDQQDELLDRAEAEGLSCAKLREIVRSMNCIETTEESDAVEEAEQDDSPAFDEPIQSDWESICVDAFHKAESRLNTLKKIIGELQPHEVALVAEWLARPNFAEPA
jgi:hypothetical protein